MVNNDEMTLPTIGIKHLCINSDGKGVRSLILTSDCPLKCRYCINNFCHDYPERRLKYYKTDQLFDQVKKYVLYYKYTNGGITFGGGEPLQYSDYIFRFCELYKETLNFCIETSLNVDVPDLKQIAQTVDTFYVDIKDMNPEIYYRYTGHVNDLVYINLSVLSSFADKIVLRLPYIGGYNTSNDIEKSKKILSKMGYYRFNRFDYIISNTFGGK